MIGSEGIHNLSRAAGDESLQRTQRVNKDGHNEQDKGGSGSEGKQSDSEKGQAGDSYEHAAEEINERGDTSDVIPFPSAIPGQPPLSRSRFPFRSLVLFC